MNVKISGNHKCKVKNIMSDNCSKSFADFKINVVKNVDYFSDLSVNAMKIPEIPDVLQQAIFKASYALAESKHIEKNQLSVGKNPAQVRKALEKVCKLLMQTSEAIFNLNNENYEIDIYYIIDHIYARITEHASNLYLKYSSYIGLTVPTAANTRSASLIQAGETIIKSSHDMHHTSKQRLIALERIMTIMSCFINNDKNYINSEESCEILPKTLNSEMQTIKSLDKKSPLSLATQILIDGARKMRSEEYKYNKHSSHSQKLKGSSVSSNSDENLSQLIDEEYEILSDSEFNDKIYVETIGAKKELLKTDSTLAISTNNSPLQVNYMNTASVPVIQKTHGALLDIANDLYLPDQ